MSFTLTRSVIYHGKGKMNQHILIVHTHIIQAQEGSSEPKEQVKDVAVNTDPTPAAPSHSLGLPQKMDDNC